MVTKPPVRDPAEAAQPSQNVPHPDGLAYVPSEAPATTPVGGERALDVAPPNALQRIEPRREDPMPVHPPIGQGATAPRPRTDVDVFLMVTILIAVCALGVIAWLAAG